MEYRLLDPDLSEIRLMTLLPSDTPRNPVSCTFEHVSLINPPEFCALSYCWGNPNVTREITINGSSCRVTTNLESVLCHLGAKGYRRFWVDPLCINQEDKTEKSQQLLWMGSIYRREKEVVAWLGMEDVSSMTVMKTLVSVDDSTTSERFFSDRAAEHHLTFLARPYWRRVWIIQELALARHIMIHCCERQVSWDQLVSVLEYTSPTSNFAKILVMVNVMNLWKFHEDISMIMPVRFLEALKRSSNALSTDRETKYSHY